MNKIELCGVFYKKGDNQNVLANVGYLNAENKAKIEQKDNYKVEIIKSILFDKEEKEIIIFPLKYGYKIGLKPELVYTALCFNNKNYFYSFCDNKALVNALINESVISSNLIDSNMYGIYEKDKLLNRLLTAVIFDKDGIKINGIPEEIVEECYDRETDEPVINIIHRVIDKCIDITEDKIEKLSETEINEENHDDVKETQK